MDFGVWGNPKANMDQADCNQNQSEQQPPNKKSGNGNSNGSNNNGNGSNDANGVVLMHHMEHTGVVCDICDTTICGFRYKCMQCPDFDLCHFCERKGHHAGHIMMRISFPEQAADAIRRYISNNGGSPPPHRPTPWCGTFPGNENAFPPFGGHKRGDRHSSRHHGHGRGGGGRDSSPDQETEESPFMGHGCPYQMSKKGIHKWTKYMKKAAHHHRRSAEAYAQSAARAKAEGQAGQAPETPAAAGAAAPTSLDFSAAASQIQEFLNAWGVPIDVVELYDEFGNRGQPNQPAASNEANASTNNNTCGGQSQTPSATETQVPVTTPSSQSVLTDQLQQLNIGNQGDNISNDTNRPATAGAIPTASAPSMDVDGETGWTLIDKIVDTAPVAPGNSENVTDELKNNFTRVSFDLPNPNDESSSGTRTTPSKPDEPNNVQANTQPSSFPHAVPVGSPANPGTHPVTPVPVNTHPVYPVLTAMQNPQFQHMIQGVSNAVGSAIRSIPIVPMGMGGFPRPQQPGQTSPPSGPKSEESGNSIPELDAQSVTTLNQLLSMGFSNHDGWLARLVVAKKGDLEAVLNALFPGGAP